jgi:hypothetical protein
MKFSYYKRLSQRQRQVYDQSDRTGPTRIPNAGDLVPLVREVARGLERDERGATESAAQRLVETILRRLHVQGVRVRVLAVRPTRRREELHGLYEFGGRRAQPIITVWMRTAQRRQVVALRTFLRTLLHEVVHHLDYQLLHLADSFHTEGFYKRAEGLYRQLVPVDLVDKAPQSPEAKIDESTPRVRSRERRQTPLQPAARNTPSEPRMAASPAGDSPRPATRRGAKTRDPQLQLPFL